MAKTKNYYIMKGVCRRMLLVGLGDFWFDKGEIGNDKTFRYRLLSGILLLIYLSVSAMSVMATIWGDLPGDEKRDSVTYTFGFGIFLVKLFSVLAKRKRITKFLSIIVDICQEHEVEHQLERNYKIIKRNLAGYYLAVSGTIFIYIFEGIRKMLAGSHFIIIVTYWPYHEDKSVAASAFRIFTAGVLIALVISMTTLDGLAITSIIMYKNKLITLKHYLEDLRMKFDENNVKGNEKYAGDQLYAGLIEGIVMHTKLMRLMKDMEYSFGAMIVIQMMVSFGTAVTLLPQLVLDGGMSVSDSIKTGLFIAGLFFLLALYLFNSGEITYQASLLSDPIFYCGWHATPMRKDLRQLVLLACMFAQRPIIMKAFKTLELTHATFIQVVRGTYSIFALYQSTAQIK